MFPLTNATDEHVNKWVVTEFGNDAIVAFDADIVVAFEKAKAAGLKQENAVIMFVHPDDMAHIYPVQQHKRNLYEILGDRRKYAVFQVRPSYMA